jgi:Domain of unknown function (DUF5122) beta-propeller
MNARASAVIVATACVEAVRAQCGAGWIAGEGLPGANDRVNALITMPNGTTVAGGYFSQIGGSAISRVAAWNGTTWSSLGTGVDGNPRCFTKLLDGSLIAGGNFTSADGGPAAYIARWNGASWLPLGTGMDASVAAVVTLGDGSIVAGGAFAFAGGVHTNGVALWNGSSWSAMGSGLGSVLALCPLPDGGVVAGGEFTVSNGSVANCIAKWDGVSWSAMGSGMSGVFPGLAVLSLTLLSDGSLVAGGSFANAGGVPAANVARWNGTSWSAMGGGVGGAVNALLPLSDGSVVAGGTMSGGLERWVGPGSGTWSYWSGGVFGIGGLLSAMALRPDGSMMVGGSFSNAGGVLINNIAHYSFGGSLPSFAEQPVSGVTCPGGSISFSVAAASGPSVTYQWQREVGTVGSNSWSNLANGTLQGSTAVVSGASTMILTIVNVDLPASRRFRCVLTNACGLAYSDPVALAVRAGGYPNCDGVTIPPVLNVADFTCFLQKFATGDPYANCDQSTTVPVLNVADFTCFLQKFAQGCP